MSTHQFVVMWDMYGLEYCEDITAAEQMKTWNTLQGIPSSVRIPNLLHLKLRAQINSQRHYEIYAIDCDAELDQTFWQERWEADPQWCADLVRKKGHMIHSDRADTDRIKII